jgi:hypothetical protein
LSITRRESAAVRQHNRWLMIARRLSLSPDTLAAHRALPRWEPPSAQAGWTRKLTALFMHCTCLALFGLFVVWPVVGPIASGELAREFQPVLEALAAWQPGAAPAPDAGS